MVLNKQFIARSMHFDKGHLGELIFFQQGHMEVLHDVTVRLVKGMIKGHFDKMFDTGFATGFEKGWKVDRPVLMVGYVTKDSVNTFQNGCIGLFLFPLLL